MAGCLCDTVVGLCVTVGRIGLVDVVADGIWVVGIFVCTALGGVVVAGCLCDTSVVGLCVIVGRIGLVDVVADDIWVVGIFVCTALGGFAVLVDLALLSWPAPFVRLSIMCKNFKNAVFGSPASSGMACEIPQVQDMKHLPWLDRTTMDEPHLGQAYLTITLC